MGNNILYKCTCPDWQGLSSTVGNCPHCGKPLKPTEYAKEGKLYKTIKAALNPTTSSDVPTEQPVSTENKTVCENCKSDQVVEFIGRNKRQCQICGHSWKPSPSTEGSESQEDLYTEAFRLWDFGDTKELYDKFTITRKQ